VRKKASFKLYPLEFLPDFPDTFDPQVYQTIAARDIMSLIRLLPRNTALVFNMYAIEGYNHREIAQFLGIAPGTSKWHLNEARRLLKLQLNLLLTNEKLSNAR
jgi:RNA polymerase sigma-70 factor (ECF subfamily)